MQDRRKTNPVELGGDFKNIEYPSRDWQVRSANRCVFFQNLYDSYERRLRDRLGLTCVFLNRYILGNLVESYFLDIARLKQFHEMKLADRYKIAGYTTKWFSRFRPLQFSEPAPDIGVNQKRTLTLLNPHFALMACASIARFDISAMPPSWRNNLLYSFHYRDVDPGVLAQMYELAAMKWPAKDFPDRGEPK